MHVVYIYKFLELIFRALVVNIYTTTIITIGKNHIFHLEYGCNFLT